MIHYDKEARLSFARERARLLQNEMRAARHASSLNPARSCGALSHYSLARCESGENGQTKRLKPGRR
jgi:hypothetical protein